MKNINSILKEVLKEIEPSKEELKDIENHLEIFITKVRKRIKSLRIDAEVFIGGSFAKGTVIKKDKYDVDLFIRFGKKYKNKELSGLTKKLLRGTRNILRIHGSRDYFQIKVKPDFSVEVIPVRKVKTPKEAENITDLSYSHVSYIKRKVKSKKLLDEIRLAKAFCYANNCYGAESYINGFSGYALELLVYHYGSFFRFVNAMTKVKPERKEVIDIEKHYKNKNRVLMDVNAAKLDSPIVLIDPTYKQRNALAALSQKTFEKFQKACNSFLKKPSADAFKIKILDFKKIERDVRAKDSEFIILEAKTNKQAGDIAGSKLLKFYNHLSDELSKYFNVKDQGFKYEGKKTAKYFFVVKKKKEIIIQGPKVSQEKHVKKFKKKHKKTYVKGGRVYSRYTRKFTLKQFLSDWKKKNSKKIKAMSVSGLRVV
jgi:tRNA CCA-adding enzyme